jgi:hypothetical protein
LEPHAEQNQPTNDHHRLARRREKRNVAKHAASVAQAAESAIHRQLGIQADRLREKKRLLQRQRAQAEALKKSIKQLEKRGEKLRGKYKSAKQDNSKAHKKLQVAEAKYERSVVDEMVRREKRIDLAEHAGRSATPRSLPPGDSPAVAAIGTAGRR